MRSTFSSAFEKIFVLNFKLHDRYSALHSPAYILLISRYEIDVQLCIQHRAVSSIFGSAFKTSFELRAMGSTYGSAFENTNVEYRAVGSIFISALNTIHTLNIELWVDIQHCIRKYSSGTSSYEIDVQLCI